MAKFCTNCGKEVPEGIAFCTECGTPAQESAPEKQAEPPVASQEPVYAPSAQPQPAYTQPPPAYTPPARAYAPPAEVAPGSGSKYEPISTGGYIGIMLLTAIPIVGLIITAIWAFGGCKKINKRNFARAMLIFFAISLVIGLLVYFVGGALVGKIVEASGLGALSEQLGGLGEMKELFEQFNELKNMQMPETY